MAAPGTDVSDIFENGNQPQNPIIPSGALAYYSNCRGVNYLPIPHTEWVKSGFVPRFSQRATGVIGLTGHDGDKVFMGANKTSQWWYYNREDNAHCLDLLRDIGINAIRVFMDVYVWNHDQPTFLANLADFMDLCDSKKMRVQLVVWDGIQIGSLDDTDFVEAFGDYVPKTRSDTNLSGLAHGLTVNWQRNPHSFEVSSEAQQLDFYTTCATPYINAVIETVSSYQSFWSIDMANEFSLEHPTLPTSSLTYSSCLLASALTSSLNIALTVGNGAGYAPFPEQLTNGNGTHPGWPNGFQILSAVINVASMHPYNNNKYQSSVFAEEAVSGAIAINVPGMYNELASHAGAYPFFMVKIWHDLGYGGLIFDGLIDYGMSKEPFRDSQGLRFWDGEYRLGADGATYASIALSSGWFSPNQLDSVFIQKAVSVDEGQDGGYWSGTPSVAATYDATTMVSATEVQWEHGAAAEAFLNLAKNPARAQMYTPYEGSEFSVATEYGDAFSGITVREHHSALLSLSSDYPLALAEYPDTDAGWVARNTRLLKVNHMVDRLATNITHTEKYLGIYGEVVGSQYDHSPISEADTLAFSATYSPLARSVGSINPVKDQMFNLDSISKTDLICHATTTCYYLGGSPTNDIDWAAYDTYYDGMLSDFRDIVDTFDLSATVNPKYEIF
tara:strand:+ start:45323 stop:47338 length:2016 start_codon:yes stop_codon:yes gene_type:complete